MARITEDHACRRDRHRSGLQRRKRSRGRLDQRALSREPCRQQTSLLEQISFRLNGGCTTQLAEHCSLNLDSDLPLYLWWQQNSASRWTRNSGLGSIESSTTAALADFQAQMRLVESAQAEAKQRIVLCDLNWTRLDKVRFALAQFFRSSRLPSSPGQNQ